MSETIVSTNDQTPNKSIPAAVDQEIEAKQSASEQDNVESDPTDDEGNQKDPSDLPEGVKKRLAKLTKTRAEFRIQAENEKKRADYYENKIRELESAKQDKADPKPKVNSDERPDPEKFDTFGEYNDALIEYNLNQREKKLRAQSEQSEKAKSFQTKVEDFKKSHADFEDVLESCDVDLSKELQQNILESDLAPNLMYHLADKPDVIEKLNGLSGNKLVRALAIIEHGLLEKPESQQTKEQPEIKTSKAPTPISPVGNKGSSTIAKSLTDPNISYAEYERQRRAQIYKK